VHKEILWESETASDAEVRAMEIKLIRETGANNPEVGYNLSPRWFGAARRIVLVHQGSAGMQSSQRLAELRDRIGVRQYAAHIGQCMGNANAA
jgi:hypothetical protein